MKKTLGIILTTLMIFSPMDLALATGIPTVDIAHIIETTIGVGENTITAIKTAIDTAQKLYEFKLTFNLQDLKQNLIGKIQDKITSYIQGGGSGTPKFVENWETYFKSARTTGAQAFGVDLKGAKLCDTFKNKVLGEVGAGAGSGNGGGNDVSQFNCDFKPGELKKFNQDFSQGGWAAYEKASKPNNNYIGAVTMARQAQSEAIQQSEKAAESEAISGGGFLGSRRDGLITTPGSVFEAAVSNAQMADLNLITNAQNVGDVAGLIDNFTSQLTKGGDNGISGISLRQRRNSRNADRNNDGSRVTMTRLEATAKCNDLFSADEAALRASCIESNASENGNGEGIKDELLSDIAGMIKSREGAKLAFNQTIKSLNKKLNLFDAEPKPNGNDIVDSKHLCAENLPGRKRKRLVNKKLETWTDGIDTNGDGDPDDPGEVPSSVTTGQIFNRSTGSLTLCATQTLLRANQGAQVFDDLLPSRNELRVLQDQNLNAYNALINYRRRLRAVSPKNENQLQALQDEFNTGKIAFAINDSNAVDETAKTSGIVYLCDDGSRSKIFDAVQINEACITYAAATGVLSSTQTNANTPLYVCGAQALTNPEFNEQCSDYTIARAKYQIGQEQPEIDGSDTVGCDPAVTDDTDPLYCEPDAG